MIDTVIFDLDGTLLNTLDDLTDSVNFALGKLGHPLRTRDEIRRFVGNSVVVLIRLALPEGASQEEYDRCMEIFKAHYEKNMHNKTAPYDGVLEMLAAVKAAGYKTAVVSNKSEPATKALCAEMFPGLLQLAVGHVPTRERKPAADGVNFALKVLGSKKETAVYVGDSEVDAATAQNSGLPCIGVLWGFRDSETLKREGVRFIAKSPDEVLNLIKEAE